MHRFAIWMEFKQVPDSSHSRIRQIHWQICKTITNMNFLNHLTTRRNYSVSYFLHGLTRIRIWNKINFIKIIIINVIYKTSLPYFKLSYRGDHILCRMGDTDLIITS